MASSSEPPRSSTSSADSYIGSLISLTSKSEIRYEGILVTINTQESSIALRNVRSFGTEGRKKDGQQVPPSDRIYEYILFRGSDIKDLQVKTSPPVQTTTQIPNDPAIIQSHYHSAPVTSTSLPSGTATGADLYLQTPQMGLPRPTIPGTVPLFQPSGSLVTWALPTPPAPTNNASGLPMPMYWQGVYGSSNGFQAQQQSLPRPPPGLSMPSSMQQTMQYPTLSTSLQGVASNLPTLKFSESPSPLLPLSGTGNQNLASSMPPVQSLDAVSDASASLILNRSSTLSLPTAVLSSSFQLAPPLNTVLDQSSIPSSASEKSRIVPSPVLPHLSKPESLTSVAGASTSSMNEAAPSLVTPGQLMQSSSTSVSATQPSMTTQKDVEVVQVSSSEVEVPPAAAIETDKQEPILPLPSPSGRKQHGTYAHYSPRGRGRGRGNRISRPVTKFTEEFDFMAMNEKFNKDEVWGNLGKSNQAQENADDLHDEDENVASKSEIKQVYNKDDFFDSISCDALDHESRNGRIKFSEQLRKDTETFGYMPKHRGGRGGRGSGHGGRFHGSYHGRGYGYGGRGWGGHSYLSRAP